jgi:hypothetical protein
MKLEKQLLLLAFLGIFALKSQAQSNQLSIGVETFYGFGLFNNSVETFTDGKLVDGSYKVQQKRFGLGVGPAVMANLSYRIVPYASINMGFRYSFLAKTDFTELSNIGAVTLEKTKKLSANRFALVPALQFNTDNDKLNAFMRLGMSLNFTNQKLLESSTLDSNKIDYYWEYKGKPNIGVVSVMGLQYQLKPKLIIAMSLAFEGLLYTPYYASIVRIEESMPTPNRPKLNPIESELDFNEWGAKLYNQEPDPNQPLQLPEQSFNYSSLAISIGVVFKL